MTFENPTAWALASVALVICLVYLWRFRQPAVEVATFALWQRALAKRPAWFVLRFWFSLALQVIILLLIVGALAKPQWTAAVASRRNWVAVIDVSASMAATDVAPHRLGAAKRDAMQLVDRLRAGEQMAVVAAGSKVSVLCNFTDDKEQLRAAINATSFTDGETRTREATGLAERLLQGRRNAHVFVFTDGCFPEAPDLVGRDRVWLHLVGNGGNNAGITRFSVRPSLAEENQYEAFVAVETHFTESREIVVELLSGDQAGDTALQTKRLNSPAGHGRHEFVASFRQQANQSRLYVARLKSSDDLAADDFAYAPLPVRTVPKVVLVASGPSPVETALRTLSGIHLTVFESMEDAAGEPAADPDIWVFDQTVPDSLPAKPTLVFRPSSSTTLWTAAGRLRDPNCRIARYDSSSPLLDRVFIGEIIIEEAAKLSIAKPYRSLVTAESGDPLIAIVENADREALVVNIDLEKSDFVLRGDFVWFVRNAIRWLHPDHADGVQNKLTADAVAIDSQVTNSLQTPYDQTIPLAASSQILTLDQAGVWRGTLTETSEENGGRAEGDIAFATSLLNSVETDIHRPEWLERYENLEIVPTAPEIPFWTVLAGLAVILVLLNFCLIHRRLVV